MIVALLGVVGAALVVAGVYMLVGTGPALVVAGAAFLAGAFVLNVALDRQRPSETPEGV